MSAPLLLIVGLLTGLTGGSAELAGGSAAVAALAVVTAGALLLTLVVALRTVPIPATGALTASAVKHRSERTVAIPLCDPDAAGRPRPRAPSAGPRAG